MKTLTAILNLRNALRMLMLAAVLCALGPKLMLLAAPTNTTTLTVVNNLDREISHLYLSPAENNNWGADLLGESPIAPGATRTVTVTWNQSSVKIIAEDRDGCFLYNTVATASSIEWTIASNSVANCGN